MGVLKRKRIKIVEEDDDYVENVEVVLG